MKKNLAVKGSVLYGSLQLGLGLLTLFLMIVNVYLYFTGKHSSYLGYTVRAAMCLSLLVLVLALFILRRFEAKKEKDDTERDQALSALELTLDNLDTCIYINEIDTGKILFINKKMAKEFGEGVEFVGRPCYEVLQNGFTEMCEFCPIPKLKKTGDPYCVWEEHNTVTGRYYQNTDSLIKWVDGQLVHMQHSVDITDRKMSEMKIAEIVNRLEAVMSNYPGILICLDTDLICTMASGTNLHKMGVEKEAMIGNNVRKVFPQYDEATMNNILDLALKGTPSSWITQIGNEYYNCYMSPLTNDRGKVYGMLFAANDITENVKNQEELKKAMELAKQGSKAKSDFLSRMSHEIRTPMNAILGMTKIAQEASDMQRIRYCLENIDLSSKHLLSLINDILDLSKIEANKMSIENERFSVEHMLKDVSNIVAEKVSDKKQRLNVFIDSKMKPFYIGDEFRISQVMINLISNAVKFTPDEGEINVSVKEIASENDITTLAFSIQDTGIGITPEQQAKLFTSFEQGDGSTARKYGGSGLGLVISKSIIEKMNGQIWIDSEPGKGSTFGFDVKLKKSDDQETGKREWNNQSLNHLRVLVVDDSPEICDYFSKIMEKFQIATDTALSGKDAVAMVSKAYGEGHPYNVIFLDWRMPEMDGIETARQINLKTKESTSIIMISTSEWIEIEAKAREVGIQKFVSKPLFPSMILDAIASSIGGVVKARETIEVKENALADFSNVNILLVEDVKVNQEVFKALMEKTKLNIDTADNGMEAVMKFQGNPDKYDIIFMDVQMPEMDGCEATSRIRDLDEISNAKTIPIVAMTANVFKEDVDKCIASGMNGHLGKPIDRDKIIEKIAMYAEQKPQVKSNVKVDEQIQQTEEFIKKEEPKAMVDDASFLPFLDLEELKAHISTDMELCSTLLRSFLDNTYAEEVVSAAKEGDIEKAKAVVHTIKGVAGNLFLKELHNFTIEFEMSLKSGSFNPEDANKMMHIMDQTKESIVRFCK